MGKERSNFWYLAPFIFGLAGGIVGYFGIRHDDPSKARNILILGVLLFLIPIAITGFTILSDINQLLSIISPTFSLVN